MTSPTALSQTTETHAIGFFEKWLTAWVFLCIAAGIALGQLVPALFQTIGRLEIAKVNIPVGLLIWVMIIPMLLKIDFGALQQVKQHWKGIGVTLFINWGVKPFSMALLAYIFIRNVFAPYLPADQLSSYIAGLIILSAAPCTAMVFVWSRLTKGDPYFTLSQVVVNDLIMVFAFCTYCWIIAWIVSDNGALGYTANFGSALYSHSSFAGSGMACMGAQGWGAGTRSIAGTLASNIVNSAAKHACIALRFSGSGDRW